jgi:hypothetical protein
MADAKISSLPASTVPLVGTEVLPIVQGGVTKQVAVSDLTGGLSTIPVTKGGTGTGTAFTAGSVVFAGTSGVYSQDNANLFWDDTNNRLGLGTTSPDTTVHLANSSGAKLRFENGTATSTTGLSMGRLEWETRDTSAPGLIGSIDVQDYNNFGTAFKMILGGGLSGAVVPALELDAVADVKVLTGNLVIGTSGKGIDFSATPGTGTSELLDDYEEGTWTPTFASSSGSFTSITYDAAVTGAKYTKIGNVVCIQGSIRTSAITVGTASGNLLIAGLPFSAVANATGQDGTASGVIGQSSAWAVNMPSALSLSASQISLFHRLTSNGASALTQVTDAGTGSAANLIRFSCTYLAA